MRRPLNSLAPLLGLLFACVFLLNLVSSLGVGQLAAYSETRSFRDALEGRSMEEAISGPVDKDTSSYGDRTSGAGNGQQSATSQDKAGAGYSSSGNSGSSGGDSASSNAGQMMINIPANGNLSPMTSTQQPDEQQQQQQQSSAGELEREAGPISADFPIDTQQQMMEQKMLMMMKAKQMMSGRSGRLTGPAPSSGMMMEMLRSMREERTKKMMMGQVGARSGRLQQDQQQEEEQRGDTKQADGEEDANNGNSNSNYGPSQMMMPSNDYGNKMNAANGRAKPYDNKATSMQNGDGYQQQMSGPQEGASYDQQQQQQQSDEMRAKYTQMMNGGGDKKSAAYRKQQTGSMGQNMMMSLANKAAYMASQRMPSARQMAPMMMVGSNGESSSEYGKPTAMPMASRSAGQSYGGQSQYGSGVQSQMQPSNGYQPMRASGAMRAMRRANQRRAEKKISPAMMNAMLNKMLMGANEANGGGQYQASGMDQNQAADSNYSGAGQQQMPMSAAKMRAQMLAQMMMMTAMADNGNGGYGASSMGGGNGNNKRDSYKMTQQQMMSNQEDEQKMEMPTKQMNGGNYGERSMPPSMPMTRSMPMSGGYGDQAQSTTPSYEGPASSSQSPMLGQGYGQQQQQMPQMGGNNYDMQQQQQEMAPDTKGMQQKQMMMPAAKSYNMATSSPMMSSMRVMPAMVYGNTGDSSSSERPPASDGKLMQQVMKVMRAKQMAMGQQGKSAYGPSDQQQMQMQTEAKEYGGESQRTQPGDMSYGTKSDGGVKGAPSTTMNRPMTPVSMGMSYDGQQQQQADDGQEQQQTNGGAYEQTSDQMGGAAPMGQAEPFAFDYKVEDEATGNNQYRKEESDKNGVVRGSYGYMDSNSGVYRHVEYVADENGFRASIKSNEPGLSDKTTSKQTKTQQQPRQQMEEASQSGAGDQAGTKGASEGSYQPARASPPPSSSSSLGGPSAALQMAAPMSKTSQQMEDQMPQQRMMQSAKMPQDQQQQQQQQTSGSELEK